MANEQSLIFKQADSPPEFEQIHQLNYQVFAKEIAQHEADGSGILVDRLHERSTYFIARRGDRVVGMVSVHDDPPFSVESRLSHPEILAALGNRLLEVRLLAVDPDRRHSMIFGELLWNLFRYARDRDYSHVIISGITDRAGLYERMGFRRLGPAVACGAASFIPMALPLRDSGPGPFVRHTRMFARRFESHNPERRISLMPGPVEIAEPVRRAFFERPISHRDPPFIEAYERVRTTLRRLSGGMDVAVLVGTGTAANDAAALQLRRTFGDRAGLVLVNGEFGARLKNQAASAGLQFRTLEWRWGDPWDLPEIAAALHSGLEWVWGVHLETSTGVLNPAGELATLAERQGVRVALDGVSSLGAVPLPNAVWLSTGVSGKSLAAYAGLSFVFGRREQLAGGDSGVPASLDAAAAISHNGPRYTVPSPLLMALDQALKLHHGTPQLSALRFQQHERLGCYVRSRLRRVGVEPLARECHAAPCVTTFGGDPDHLAGAGARAGFELTAHTGYLRQRGWVQIATMGSVTEADLETFWPAVESVQAAPSRFGGP